MAGIFLDLCIEQGLMWSVKKTGGLSRVRTFDEVTRLVWLLSTPICVSVVRSMHSLVGLDNTFKDTHQDISKATMARDLTDTQTILEYFTEGVPFSMFTTELHSLSSGIIASGTINVHDSKVVGEAIVMRMANKSVKDYSFKQTDQVINLNSKLRLSVGGGGVQIDPKVLFQRLLLIAINQSVDLATVFNYELCAYPPSLFDANQCGQ